MYGGFEEGEVGEGTHCAAEWEEDEDRSVGGEGWGRRMFVIGHENCLSGRQRFVLE